MKALRQVECTTAPKAEVNLDICNVLGRRLETTKENLPKKNLMLPAIHCFLSFVASTGGNNAELTNSKEKAMATDEALLEAPFLKMH